MSAARFGPGAWCWYEPSQGARFACVVQDEVGRDATVLVAGNYFQWKHGEYRSAAVLRFVAWGALHQRDSFCACVDTPAGGAS